MSKLIYGIGENDANYTITQSKNGTRVCCPYYVRWHGILRRCYSKKFHNHSPCYSGCQISNEWKKFSTFKEWMEQEDWVNKELDKDLLIPGNKTYGPERCIFVPHNINSFLTYGTSKINKFPLGCHYRKKSNYFISRIEIDNNKIILGSFSNPMEAHRAWQKEKIKCINNFISAESDSRLVQALTRISNNLLYEYNNNLETKIINK